MGGGGYLHPNQMGGQIGKQGWGKMGAAARKRRQGQARWGEGGGGARHRSGDQMGGRRGGARWEQGQMGVQGVEAPIWYPFLFWYPHLLSGTPFPIWYPIQDRGYPYSNESPKSNSSLLDILSIWFRNTHRSPSYIWRHCHDNFDTSLEKNLDQLTIISNEWQPCVCHIMCSYHWYSRMFWNSIMQTRSRSRQGYSEKRCRTQP